MPETIRSHSAFEFKLKLAGSTSYESKENVAAVAERIMGQGHKIKT